MKPQLEGGVSVSPAVKDSLQLGEMAASEEGGARAVGPYILQRTLGKGQTGENWGKNLNFCVEEDETSLCIV